MGQIILQDILIIFAMAIPIVVLIKKLHLPPMLGFLATGALIGPFGFEFVMEKVHRQNTLDFLLKDEEI